MKVGVVDDPLFYEHEGGAGHPERPERLAAIRKAIHALPFADELVSLDIRDAMPEELLLVHDESYLEVLEQSSTREHTVFDADTRANSHSYAAARRAAGAVISAVDAAMNGELIRSFVLCRPPGHHAERSRAMGFCFLNNVAIAAAHAVEHSGADRVAIVDWDVHHGNGTAHMFAGRADILYLSIHQSPHYPGTGFADEVGFEQGRGYTVNIPLPAGSADDDYLAIFDRVVMPVVGAYQPDLILVSAGFDPHARDPLSGMLLTRRGFGAITKRLVRLADEHSGGRIVHVLEGGYDLAGLAEGVSAVLEVLCDWSGGEEETSGPRRADVAPVVEQVVDMVQKTQREFWPV